MAQECLPAAGTPACAPSFDFVAAIPPLRDGRLCFSFSPRVATLTSPMSRQRLGQHFLHDIGWRKRILATLPLTPNQTWIEIGPGHGEMTQLLVGEGRRIVVIETDQRLAEGLRTSRDTDPAKWPSL